MFTWLALKGMLPEFLKDENKMFEDNKIYAALVLTHVGNYNSFLTTIIVKTLIIMPSAWLVTNAQMQVRLDPYTGESLEEHRVFFS